MCTFYSAEIFLEFVFHAMLVILTGFPVHKGDKDGGKVTTVIATSGSLPDRTQEISYADTKVIGNGSFGVVYQARLCESDQPVAIKKVLQDKRFKVWTNFSSFPIANRAADIVCLSVPDFSQPNLLKFHVFPQNRELQIMRKLDHCNIVKLKYFFYSSGEKVRTRSLK